MDFIYLTTTTEAAATLEAITASVIALDIETYSKRGVEKDCLNPHLGDISIISIYDGDQVYVFDWLQLEAADFDRGLLSKFLASRKYIIAHNALFDGLFLRAKLQRVLHNWHCTYLLSLLIANATGSKFGRMRGHRLSDLCRDVLGVSLSGKGTLQVSDWGFSDRRLENSYWREKITYATNDVRYLIELHDQLWHALTAPISVTPPSGLGMQQTAELEMQNITPTIEMLYHGLPINTQLAAALDEQVQKQRKALAVKLCKEFNLPTLITDLFSPEEPAPSAYTALNNPNSLLTLIANKLGKDLPNTQSALLERLLTVIEELSTDGSFEYKDKEEEELYKELEYLEHSVLVQSTKIVRMILEYRRLTKQMAFDLRQYINPATQRIHPSYNPLGTATGRFSSSKPNAQQISARLAINVPLDVSPYLPASSKNLGWKPRL